MRLARRLTTCATAVLGLLGLLALPGAAAARDGNHDRIPDRWEKRHHLSTKVNQARRDQDQDGLRNRAEFLAGDNPRDRDSDDDGVIDGEENAGTIQSFDAESGRLVISLFGGETISGLVSEGTRIECEREHADDDSIAMRGGEDESGDDRGERGEEPGDDNSGEGNSGPGHNGEDNSGPGSANSGPDRGDRNGEDANCTSADLVAGAVVQEAELELEQGIATFEEVELAG